MAQAGNGAGKTRRSQQWWDHVAEWGASGPPVRGVDRHFCLLPPCNRMARHAYAGCYTDSGLRWVGADPGRGITAFRFDSDKGELTPVGEVAQENPAWLEVDPTGRFLLATHEFGPAAPE
eukprot:gene5158-923_t